jgi:LysR family transcriptional regulator, glycine cleavage system transcriptional activator
MHLPMRSIAVFHAAARAGSVSRAAKELGVTASAVSQQIASLEIYLGTSLMVKSGRRVVLTEAGERYFEMIAENVDRISDATQVSAHLPRLTVCRLRGRTAIDVTTAATIQASGDRAPRPHLPLA